MDAKGFVRESSVPITLGSPRFKTVEVDGFRVTEAWFPPLLRLPPHYHDRAAFAVMLDGAFDLEVTSLSRRCPPGTVFTEPIAERHGNRVGGAGAHVVVVQPDPRRVDLVETCRGVFGSFNHLRYAPIADLARRLVLEIRDTDSASALVMEGTALAMLGEAERLITCGRTGGRPPLWLRRARDLLHARFLGDLRTADVATEVGVHPVHLARVFRAHQGVTIGAYVRRLRLDWAAGRLARSQDQLGDIALEAGFADQSHFTRAFRLHTGSTPGQYRRRMTPSS